MENMTQHCAAICDGIIRGIISIVKQPDVPAHSLCSALIGHSKLAGLPTDSCYKLGMCFSCEILETYPYNKHCANTSLPGKRIAANIAIPSSLVDLNH